MKRINTTKFHLFTLYFGLTYFLYSLILTGYDFFHLKHENWLQAENQTTIYSSSRSTTVTYNFVKDEIRISRKYPGIFEGLNTWFWRIDKEKNKIDISFYIRQKDNERINNKEIRHRTDIFGGELNEIEPIPYFGLRKIHLKPNKLLLFLDIWKYNYSILIAFILLVLPYIIIFITKKIFKVSLQEDKDSQLEHKIGGMMILCFILLFVNLIV
ncbi:hypothetical protein [Chryseobacterium jejuense]|uniref:hypothetical protein n=1 Tax=Chryseobacterium jejuense TaxID=445960 RepID=UPI001AE8E3B6|nr:hypothetical protein [Chryseobacterium jejuense]MBP2619649.1 hypothetical protein [Chryseobacterium jejuense]